MKDLGNIKGLKEDRDSLKILTIIFSHAEFYLNIEGILAVLARACVIIGVESVVESWVSQNEHHNNKRRPLGESLNFTETAVAINGPNPVNCDNLIEEALKEYFKDCKMKNSSNGHFIRRSSNIKSYCVSKSVDRTMKVPPKFPWMSSKM